MRKLEAVLRQNLFRVALMDAPGHMNNKIKEAQRLQIPFMLIAGDREPQDNSVAVRKRGTREQVVMPFDEFHALIAKLRESRAISID